jgi:arginine deiminase
MVIDWLLSTLEIGHAVIALRELRPEINHPYFSELLLEGLNAIAELHETPTETLRMKALKAIDNAIENLTSDISTDMTMPEAEHELRRQALSMLHFIHSALLDKESVLVAKEKS